MAQIIRHIFYDTVYSPVRKKTRFARGSSPGRVRVACGARACRCLCREHGSWTVALWPGPDLSLSFLPLLASRAALLLSFSLCLSDPVPVDGSVWDMRPCLVLTVASDRGPLTPSLYLSNDDDVLLSRLTEWANRFLLLFFLFSDRSRVRKRVRTVASTRPPRLRFSAPRYIAFLS